MTDATMKLARLRNEPTMPGTGLGEVLDFMSVLWTLNHALESLSKVMHSGLGVTGPQRLVLRLVGQAPGVSAGNLAVLMRVHPSTLTGVLRRLEERGLLIRRSDASDARRALFSLTALGQSIDRLRSGTVEAAISRALRRFEGREMRIAARLLSQVARTLEDESKRSKARRTPR
jgi:DNA-binding MarR family transcriptional regulator